MPMPLVRVHGADDVRLDSVETPSPGDEDVLLKVALCGVCGSDLGYIAMGGLGLEQPMPLGHELVGSVEALGSRVTGLAVGDRVVVNPMAAGNRIGNGGPEGGFAPYLLVRGVARDAGTLYRVPATLDDRQSALVEPLSVALHACHQAAVRSTDKVVVLGAGPIGLCIMVCLRWLGVEDVIAVDLSAYRRDCAAQLGAIPCDPADHGMAEFLREHHGSAELLGMPVPATDIYLEATGARAAFEQCVNSARSDATIVIVGLHKQPVQLDLANVLLRELRIVGSMAYPDEFPEVIELLAKDELDTQALISHQFPLSGFSQALRQARDASTATKVLVDCQA